MKTRYFLWLAVIFVIAGCAGLSTRSGPELVPELFVLIEQEPGADENRFIDAGKKLTEEEFVRLWQNIQNINAATEDGKTALFFVAGYNADPELVSLMVSSGADPNYKDNFGNTPLAYAVKNQTEINVLSRLLDEGADPNRKNKQGETPLMTAAQYRNSPEIINLLIHFGADIGAKNREGLTAYDYALYNRGLSKKEIEKVLQ